MNNTYYFITIFTRLYGASKSTGVEIYHKTIFIINSHSIQVSLSHILYIPFTYNKLKLYTSIEPDANIVKPFIIYNSFGIFLSSKSAEFVNPNDIENK